MKHLRRSLVLWILIPLLFGAFLFREQILIHTAPRFVLSRAFAEAFAQLEARFSGSPIQILAQNLDPQGCCHAELSLDTSNAVLGLLRWNMDIKTQGDPAQVLAQGSVTSDGRKTDLSVFLGNSFAAISASKNDIKGKYYGIGYESFRRDLEQKSLLSALIGKQTIAQWDSFAAKLEKVMSHSYVLPDFSLQDLRSACFGLLVLRPKVSRQLITFDGQPQNVHAATFCFSGQQLASLAESQNTTLPQELRVLITKLKNDPNSMISAVFYLSDRTIIRAEGELLCSGRQFRFTADLGEAPAENPVQLTFSSTADTVPNQWIIASKVRRTEQSYSENISITNETNGIRKPTVLNYSRDTITGETVLKIQRQGREHKLRFTLHPKEDGFLLRTDQFFAMLNVFLPVKNTEPAICTIDVSKGKPFSAPEYLNLSEWSLEDTLSLLSVFQDFIGLSK